MSDRLFGTTYGSLVVGTVFKMSPCPGDTIRERNPR
jgi:hypothetical protein